MKRRLRLFPLIWAVLVLVGCSEETVIDGSPCNEPPVVWLSSGPPEGSTTDYRIRFTWGGWDPDGTIALYEYAITDNQTGVFNPADTVSTPGDLKWSRVDGNDSVFTFSADELPDSTGLDDPGPYTFERSHTFFVRAVDGDGARSRLPAYRSFTATTLSPTVFITTPRSLGLNPSPIPPIATFWWQASDPDGSGAHEPDSVRWILVDTRRFGGTGEWGAALDFIRQNPDAPEWSDWHFYRAPGDSGRSWRTPPLDNSTYYFAIQAMDEAGAVTPVFDHATNLRRVLVGRDGFPILTVYNPYVGTVRTASNNTPPVIFDMPGGLEIAFEFSGSAEAYGGVIVGYRCRWDAIDPNDDDEWTPFIGETAICSSPTAYDFGTHSVLIEVIDNSGFKTRFEARINIVPFTIEKDLLFVDDWAENSTCFAVNGGVTPCDAEHDAFWAGVLESAVDFNPNSDMIELGGVGLNQLPIQLLVKYKNVIWNATGHTSGESTAYLDDLITFRHPERSQSFGRITPNLLAMYMAAGGHVLLTGNQIMTTVITPAVMRRMPVFPIIFRYELGGDQDGVYGPPNDVGVRGIGEDSFAYKECCLNVLDQSFLQNSNQIRRTGGDESCPVDRIRNNDRIKDGMRAALAIDMATGGGFPRLELRPEVAGSGRFHEIAGLAVDVYNPLYFSDLTPCGVVAEINPPRSCFEPIYGNGCPDAASVLYSAPVAFWTGRFEDRIADAPGGVGARSAVWGFHPVYFEPSQVKAALEIILHDEWELPRKVSRQH